jgi:hypothetical protein
VLPNVGVLFIVIDVGTWFWNALMRLFFSLVEVSSYYRRSRCVGLLMFSISL